jgi:hypothetical protein
VALVELLGQLQVRAENALACARLLRHLDQDAPAVGGADALTDREPTVVGNRRGRVWCPPDVHGIAARNNDSGARRVSA